MGDSREGWRRFVPEPGASSFASKFAAEFAGQTVCIAGAGGDIGSALVKALAHEKLRLIILLDSSEHGLFEIQRQMEATHPATRCEYVLGSVQDKALLGAVFDRLRPQIVFHAAAFKHVRLLEHSPAAAIRNNVLGTYALVRTALHHGIEKLVLLSTDKAVRPHSVMGVSKRIAELVTVSLSCETFGASAVRLGNVIGSRGSVIPIFIEQIQRGGPVLVTHSEAARYFLSREEAVAAILAAGIAACAGKILIPEMEAPVRVAQLAEFLIETYSPNGRPEVRFTGLRAGEKLTEDLVRENEVRVGMVDGSLSVFDTERRTVREIEEAMARLEWSLEQRDTTKLVELLCELVPEYEPSELMKAR